MSREATAALVGGLVLAVAVVAVGLGLGGRSERIESPFAVAPQPERPGEASVIGAVKSVGTSLFGLRFGGSSYYADVQLVVGAGCSERLAQGDPWPVPAVVECESDVAISGEIVGLGTTRTGESIVGVRVEITGACYESLSPGDGWPPARPGCPSA